MLLLLVVFARESSSNVCIIYAEYCYQLVLNEKSDWVGVEEQCNENNATLAVPYSLAELRVIKQTGAGKGFWLGMECQEGSWIPTSNQTLSKMEEIPELPEGYKKIN